MGLLIAFCSFLGILALKTGEWTREEIEKEETEEGRKYLAKESWKYYIVGLGVLLIPFVVSFFIS